MTNIERRTVVNNFAADWQGRGDEKQEAGILLDWYAAKDPWCRRVGSKPYLASKRTSQHGFLDEKIKRL